MSHQQIRTSDANRRKAPSVAQVEFWGLNSRSTRWHRGLGLFTGLQLTDAKEAMGFSSTLKADMRAHLCLNLHRLGDYLKTFLGPLAYTSHHGKPIRMAPLPLLTVIVWL